MTYLLPCECYVAWYITPLHALSFSFTLWLLAALPLSDPYLHRVECDIDDRIWRTRWDHQINVDIFFFLMFFSFRLTFWQQRLMTDLFFVSRGHFYTDICRRLLFNIVSRTNLDPALHLDCANCQYFTTPSCYLISPFLSKARSIFTRLSRWRPNRYSGSSPSWFSGPDHSGVDAESDSVLLSMKTVLWLVMGEDCVLCTIVELGFIMIVRNRKFILYNNFCRYSIPSRSVHHCPLLAVITLWCICSTSLTIWRPSIFHGNHDLRWVSITFWYIHPCYLWHLMICH